MRLNGTGRRTNLCGHVWGRKAESVTTALCHVWQDDRWNRLCSHGQRQCPPLADVRVRVHISIVNATHSRVFKTCSERQGEVVLREPLTAGEKGLLLVVVFLSCERRPPKASRIVPVVETGESSDVASEASHLEAYSFMTVAKEKGSKIRYLTECICMLHATVVETTSLDRVHDDV